MSEAKIVLPALGGLENGLLLFVLVSGIFAIGYGWYVARLVLREEIRYASMKEVQAAIHEGAMAYLKRQFKVMKWLVLVIAIGLFFMYTTVYEGFSFPAGIALSFVCGVLASYGAGFVGMWLAVKANARVASAALSSFKKSLEIAFRAGTVSGMFTVGLGLLGACIIFLVYQQNATKVLVGFGFGGCIAALFMRVGGGIFTKSADVGADLVGKVEKSIPEDDPRNAATIADNVGDNVGDCAGMAADVFESYEVTLVAAILLGAATLLDSGFVKHYGQHASSFALKLIIFPFLVRAVGVFASILGTWSVRGRDDRDINPMRPIRNGFHLSCFTAAVGFGIVNWLYLKDPITGQPDFRFFFATATGIVLCLVIGWLTEHFTATDRTPVKETAHASRTGAATLILNGFSVGLESTVWAIVFIAITIFASAAIFHKDLALGAYGIALAGLGLLTTTGYILAMDTYGPIADNANGIFEMSGVLSEADMKTNPAHRIVAKLDAVGNTTKALTKGFAIATAVIAAISLFRSFIDEAHLAEVGIQINLPNVFIGVLIGGAVPFLFCSFAIKAVSRAAFQLVNEVRRQFREIPGIMERVNKPDYSRCVAIATAAAQKELLGPALLGVMVPILVGFSLGAAALGGYLAGAILTGQLLAVMLANSGGAWDNAKKLIEEGLFGGKGTDCHKAAVIGDTVGDPFKDTAGPALNPLIKVMNLVSILIAPIVIKDLSFGVKAAIVFVALAVLAGVVIFSKKSSILTEGEELPKTTQEVEEAS